MEYHNLFKELYDKEIRYLICGGLAVNIYGIPRMTADIDLLVDFDSNNIAIFEEILNSLNYNSMIPISLTSLTEKSERIRLKKEKNLIAYSYFNSLTNQANIDVLIDTPHEFESLWKRKELRVIENYKVNLLSIDDLIEMKKYANRTQDKNDILLLSKLKNDNT